MIWQTRVTRFPLGFAILSTLALTSVGAFSSMTAQNCDVAPFSFSGATWAYGQAALT